MQRLRLGGEADQVVHHDVHRAAHGVAREVGQVQGLGGDPLTREGGVAVQRHRQHGIAAARLPPFLVRPRPPHHHRVDRLQVARVGDQVDRDRAAGGSLVGPRRSLVVLEIAAAQDAARIEVLETGEQVGGRHARDQVDDVEPAAVAHGHERPPGAVSGGGVEQGVEERDEGRRAFQGVALRADEALVQEALEQLGLRQPLEQAPPVDRFGLPFQPLGHEAAAVRAGEVHELGADRPAVDGTPAARLPAGGPLETLGRREVGVPVGLKAPERVEVGLQVSPAPVGVGDRSSVPLARRGHRVPVSPVAGLPAQQEPRGISLPCGQAGGWRRKEQIESVIAGDRMCSK